MYISLSPRYAVRNENGCSYLINVEQVLDKDPHPFGTMCIPPFMGYIIAHIGDYEYNKSINIIADKLGISKEAISNFVRQLENNEETKLFALDEESSVRLPKRLLLKSDGYSHTKIFENEDFTPTGNFTIKRPSMPLSINLMITTQCTTDCIYCYADKSLSPILDTNAVLHLIDELHEGGMVNITLTGGDIFARKDWSVILSRLRELEYFPYISTKTPISENEISILKELGYNEIQFSLDSKDIEVLNRMINPPQNYLNSVKQFLNNAQKVGINVLIRSVLTSLNSDMQSIESLYDFLSQHQAVKGWDITPAFFSKYKDLYYKNIEVSKDALQEIYKFSKRDNLKFPIGLNKISENGYSIKKCDTVEDYVCHNQVCMANTSGMSILANGKCTVCEMLYEDEPFLIGNATKDTIKDIWNSQKALDLYSLKQETINNDSPCRKCPVFERCRNGYGKKVCYLDIRKTGKDLSYPDPRCPEADDYDIIF